MCILASPAFASTRGFENGTPIGGLGILLVLAASLVLLCIAILLLDRLRQKKIDDMKQRNDIDGLVKALRSPLLGKKAARALGEIADDRVVEPLIRALGDQRQDVRKTAAEALGKVGDIRAIEPLSRAMSDSYDSVRVSARVALDCVRKRNRPAPGQS
jgi:HEAT repeat protein